MISLANTVGTEITSGNQIPHRILQMGKEFLRYCHCHCDFYWEYRYRRTCMHETMRKPSTMWTSLLYELVMVELNENVMNCESLPEKSAPGVEVIECKRTELPHSHSRRDAQCDAIWFGYLPVKD